MTDNLEIVHDERGLAVLGEAAEVERFLAEQQLQSRPLDLQRLRSSTIIGAQAAQAGAALADTAGRWVKLTPESARILKGARLMSGPGGSSRAIVITKAGSTKHILQLSQNASNLASPALLTGAAGLLAQVAAQQQMDEISDYLAVIDEKVDDVLQSQKDAVIADAIGVEYAIDEAMSIRKEVGRVSDITWSKVQPSAAALGRTQAYALRQLDALAEKLERKGDLGDVAKTAKAVEVAAGEWIAVLAYCFRLQEAVAVLELDRVMDAAPDELEQHRRGLEVARQERLRAITSSTEQLLDRVAAASVRANKRVLLNPIDSPAVVRSSSRVGSAVSEFHKVIGIGRADEAIEARRWLNAAGDLRDRVVEAGAGGVQAGTRLGLGTRDRARAMTHRVAAGIADRTSKTERNDDDHTGAEPS